MFTHKHTPCMCACVCLYLSKVTNNVAHFFLLLRPFMHTEFDSRIEGLTGAVSAIRQMAQEYRVYFKKVEEEGDDYLVESSHNL